MKSILYKSVKLSRVSAIALMVLCAFSALAASFTVQAPRQVVQGNKFNVTYVLRDAEGTNFSAPEIGGATKLYGPGISTSYSSSWVNGKSSSSSTQEFTMIYKATTTGKFKVGAASIVVDGKRISSKPFEIEVISAGSAERREQQRRNSVQYDDPVTQSADKDVKSTDIFVRISMSKQHVFEQEAVVCTIKLYTKYRISQFMPTLQPSFNGFLIEELPLSPTLNNVEQVNGQNYMTAELKKCILYPQQSGKLTITSGNYDVTVVQYQTYSSPFGSLQQPVERKIQVKSNSASVQIDPLPEPKPAGFNGAVGTFSVKADINPKALKTYAASTLSYVVSGTGNIKYVKAPVIKWPTQFDVYDPQNKVDAKVVGSNVTGQVRFDYTFIPQYVGKFEIPATEFVYFNPETRKYVTLSTQTFNLDVAKGSGQPSSHYKNMQQNVDIRHINTKDLSVSRTHSYMISSVGYWLAYVIPLLLLLGVMWYYRKQLRERADIKRMRTKRASKVAQKRLRQARKFMSAGDRNGFYAEMLNATWGYISDKLSIPGSELNRDNIQTELERYGVDEQLRQRVIDLLDKCEFAQYAPELANSDMAQVCDEGAAVMDALENVKPAKKQS